MSDRLALEFISALGMPPDRMAALVGALGLRQFGLAAQPITRNAPAYAPWNLAEDRALRARTREAMASHAVSLVLGEGFLLAPGEPLDRHRPALDALAELGAPRINAISMGGDGAAAIDAFAAFADHVRERGMALCVEFLPVMPPATFGAALAFADAAGVEVLVDAMHFFRSGATTAELASVPPGRVGHVQICDVPMPAMTSDYGAEASQNRLPPGEGDLPLRAFLDALPAEVTIGLELPMMRHAGPDTDMQALLAPTIEATRRLLAATT